MFVDTTWTLSDLSSWGASGKRSCKVTPSREWKQIHSVPVSHQSSEAWLFIVWGFFVLFLISLFDRVYLFFSFLLSTLNCTRQDILFWNGTTPSALINVIFMVLIESCHCERSYPVRCEVCKIRSKHNLQQTDIVSHTVWPEALPKHLPSTETEDY